MSENDRKREFVKRAKDEEWRQLQDVANEHFGQKTRAAQVTETIERMTCSRIDTVIRDLKQTLEDCLKFTDPQRMVESEQAYIAKLRMSITAMEAIMDRPL